MQRLIVLVFGLVSLTLAQRPLDHQAQPDSRLNVDPLIGQRDPRLNVDPLIGQRDPRLNVDPYLAHRPGFRPTLNTLNNGQLTPSQGATILRSENENSGDGTFRYGFETSDGIKQEANGFVKEARSADEGPILVIQGSYSYISPEGIPITVNYIADELGFRAVHNGEMFPKVSGASIQPHVDPLHRNPIRPVRPENELLGQDLNNQGAYNQFRQPLGRPQFDRRFNNNQYNPYNNDPRFNQQFPNQNQVAGAPAVAN